MVSDPYLAETFPLPPLIAYKRQANIGSKLVRSKIPKEAPPRPKRNIPGMTKCNKCQICPFVTPGKLAKATATKNTHEICQNVNCQDRNVIYLIGCSHCKMQYVGESERTLKERFSEHKGYMANHRLNKATGYHFNSTSNNFGENPQ